MNRDRMQGKWQELKGKVRERWGKLTDDDMDRIGGKKDQLVGRLRERYGWAQEQVDREVSDFEQANGRFEEDVETAGQGRGMDGDPEQIERGAPARAPQRSDRGQQPGQGRSRRRA